MEKNIAIIPIIRGIHLNHYHMVSLYFVHYNFVKVHGSLRVTPAMAAGLTETLHDMDWLVDLVDAAAPEPNRPKIYKKRDRTPNRVAGDTARPPLLATGNAR